MESINIDHHTFTFQGKNLRTCEIERFSDFDSSLIRIYGFYKLKPRVNLWSALKLCSGDVACVILKFCTGLLLQISCKFPDTQIITIGWRLTQQGEWLWSLVMA